MLIIFHKERVFLNRTLNVIFSFVSETMNMFLDESKTTEFKDFFEKDIEEIPFLELLKKLSHQVYIETKDKHYLDLEKVYEEKSKKVTPEDFFDRRFLSGNYRIFLLVLLFLFVGGESFVGVMPTEVAIAAAGIISGVTVIALAIPLFWELDVNNRAVRRIHRALYFPIRRVRFVLSKWKLMLLHGGVLWLVSLVVQLAFAPLFGLENLIPFQGTMAVAFVVYMLFFTVIGTAGVLL